MQNSNSERLPKIVYRWCTGIISGLALVLWAVATATAVATWRQPHAFLVEGLAIAAASASFVAIAMGTRILIRDTADRHTADLSGEVANLREQVAKYRDEIDDRTVKIHASLLQIIASNAMSAARIQAQAERLSGHLDQLDQYWIGYNDGAHDVTGGGVVVPFRGPRGA